MTRQNKTIWTLGNMLMVVGAYLLLYVGGLYADERYNVMAADGASTIPLPSTNYSMPIQHPVTPPPVTPRPSTALPVPSRSQAVLPSVHAVAPSVPDDIEPRPHIQLSAPGGGRELSSAIPQTSSDWGDNTITRVTIPGIMVDKKVQEVGWHLEQQNGRALAIWDVSQYAVGHHKGTANPGDSGNIVLAGHSGGAAYPFNDLYYVPIGSKVVLWKNDQQFSYTVTERLVVDEEGPTVTDAQRHENARSIEETPTEQVTLVTCWPLSGPLKFTQRVIVRAVPDHSSSTQPIQGSISTP